MQAKVILSSKGHLIIPKFLRSELGLHLGSEIIIQLKGNDTLELRPVRKNIKDFFGLGKKKAVKQAMSTQDMDTAIGKAVTDTSIFGG